MSRLGCLEHCQYLVLNFEKYTRYKTSELCSVIRVGTVVA